jgi:hypothetical protein
MAGIQSARLPAQEIYISYIVDKAIDPWDEGVACARHRTRL